MLKNLILIVAAVCGSVQAETYVVSGLDADVCSTISANVTVVEGDGMFGNFPDPISSVDCSIANNPPAAVSGMYTRTIKDLTLILGDGFPDAGVLVFHSVHFVNCSIWDGSCGGSATRFIKFVNCKFTDCNVGVDCATDMIFADRAEFVNSFASSIELYSCEKYGSMTFESEGTYLFSGGLLGSVTQREPGGQRAYNPVGIIELAGTGSTVTFDPANPTDCWGAGPTLFSSTAGHTIQNQPPLLNPANPSQLERADLDGNGSIGFGDQQIVLSRWNQCYWNDPSGDNVINFSDLQIINSLWGQTY